MIVWSRNMTREKLHESEDIKKELKRFYDYDRLLEAFGDMDDEQLKDVVDSDERFDAIDTQYYDEEVRPKIEAQTYDGIVLLVERPEEGEPDPDPDKKKKEESLKEGKGIIFNEKKVEDAAKEVVKELGWDYRGAEYYTSGPSIIVNRPEGGPVKDKEKRALRQQIEDKFRELFGDDLVVKVSYIIPVPSNANRGDSAFLFPIKVEKYNLDDEENESLKESRKNNESKYSKYFIIKEAEGEEVEDEFEAEDELPHLDGMAIMADEIPEEFPEAKIVDDGDGFVLEDGDKKYDMYAIPEDKVEEFIENCMDNSVEESLHLYEDDEEDLEAPELSVEEIDNECDFSKVPEFCERITGEPVKEEPEEEEEPVEEAVKNPNFDEKRFGKFFDKDGVLKPDMKAEYFKEVEKAKKEEPIEEDTMSDGPSFKFRLSQMSPEKAIMTIISNIGMNLGFNIVDYKENGSNITFKIESKKSKAPLGLGRMINEYIKHYGLDIDADIDDMPKGNTSIITVSIKNSNKSGQSKMAKLGRGSSDNGSLKEAKANNIEDLALEVEEVDDLIDEYGVEYFTPGMTFEDFKRDYPELGALYIAYIKETWNGRDSRSKVDTKDPSQVEEIWSGRPTLSIGDNGMPEYEGEYADAEGAKMHFNAVLKMAHQLVDNNNKSVYWKDEYKDTMSDPGDSTSDDELVDDEYVEEALEKPAKKTMKEQWVIYEESNGPAYGKVVYSNGDTCKIVNESRRLVNIKTSSIKESFDSKLDAVNTIHNMYKKPLDEEYTDFDEVDNQVADRLNRAVEAYYSRMRAQNEEFDEASTPVNENVLNATCNKVGYDPGQLRKELQNRMKSNESVEPIVEADEEDPAVEKAAEETGAKEVIDNSDDRGEIWKALDRSLKTARSKNKVMAAKAKQSGKEDIRIKNFPNVLFIGGAGIGKTAVINQWAEENGINLFTLQGSSLDAADMGGLPMVDRGDGTKAIRAQKVGTGILDQLDEPNSVLFLDELNRARTDVRAALLQLINEHIIPDYTAKGGMRYFPNFLFTVAAINPAGKGGFQTFELDPAEKGRFRNINVHAENAATLRWLVKNYTEEAELLKDDPEEYTAALGRVQLAKTIVGNKGFIFDDTSTAEENEDNENWNGLETTPRNFTMLLDNSNGTKADVLDMWDQYCNNLHLPFIQRILQNYKDVENKANEPFKTPTQSPLLNRQNSPLDRLKRMRGN